MARRSIVINTTPIPPVWNSHPDRYEFHVTDFMQNFTNLEQIHALLDKFGHPEVQIVVTVSPVPLMDTFPTQDLVLANTYSKSLLRTVAQEWAAAYENVHYLPSYEIILNLEKAVTWEEDLRHVQGTLVNHIMPIFLDSYLNEYALCLRSEAGRGSAKRSLGQFWHATGEKIDKSKIDIVDAEFVRYAR